MNECDAKLIEMINNTIWFWYTLLGIILLRVILGCATSCLHIKLKKSEVRLSRSKEISQELSNLERSKK